jgi:hypothetical protein
MPDAPRTRLHGAERYAMPNHSYDWTGRGPDVVCRPGSMDLGHSELIFGIVGRHTQNRQAR